MKENELVSQQKNKKFLRIDAKMTNPSISIVDDGLAATGSGLALIGAPIEQDAAYLEWKIELQGGKTQHIDSIMFGVSTKKNRKYYAELSENKDSSSNETEEWMKVIECQNGDVIGVAIQQSDLPMIQFTLNGEMLYDVAINRFRGTVFPSIFLPDNTDDDVGELKATVVLEESKFEHISPAAKFGPIIVARSIV